ncbi:MAG TPA: DNA alkylation repair protein [Ornithinibacter sp.]|mgnify:FL=1|nr:DNA alkylation repair protein [Ornithinibacter sp.]HQA13820.1 DNA alkylation repair protein [Ornithinibacter sp.]HQD69441.1 DNA alkylation repair protein [Ornithinibacter sp.]
MATASAPPNLGLVAAIRAALADPAVGDPERAVNQRAYMKSPMPFRGLSKPELTVVLRPLLRDRAIAPHTREEWSDAVRDLVDHATHREEWYAALAVAGHRVARPWQDPDTLALYRHVVTSTCWWDIVDPVAADFIGPILLSHRDVVTPLVRADAVDPHLWVRRTAILAQLKHRAATDMDLLADVLDANLEGSLHGKDFFIRKAVGWALRQHARVDADWVREYVDSRASRLSGLSRREALKHL